MKRVAVLGSTGSIGRSTLEVIRGLGQGYQVVALSANSSWELLAEQVAEFRPRRVVLTEAAGEESLRGKLRGHSAEISVGPDALAQLASEADVDIFVVAIVGAAGLPATVAAAQSGKTLAIANKEPLVMAGGIVMALAEKHGTTVVPVDSEHSAVFQALRAGKRSEVRRIIITASGGPFRDARPEALAAVTPAQALNHPTWRMGAKITMDSATLMNKALEVIEAKWLFGLDASQIDVVVHPQSIIHSMVEFCDGSVVAQMGLPDMKVPIRFALTYPDRAETDVPPLDLVQLGSLTFQAPDFGKFPALRLGYEVARTGGTLGAVLNGANEVAVKEFLDGRIKFTDIIPLVEQALRRHSVVPSPSLDDIIRADEWARSEVHRCLSTN